MNELLEEFENKEMKIIICCDNQSAALTKNQFFNEEQNTLV